MIIISPKVREICCVVFRSRLAPSHLSISQASRLLLEMQRSLGAAGQSGGFRVGIDVWYKSMMSSTPLFGRGHKGVRVLPEQLINFNSQHLRKKL